MAAADDYRNVAQLRAVAFLNGGVEGVAVEMGDGETVEFLVPKTRFEPQAGQASASVGGRWPQSRHRVSTRSIIGAVSAREKMAVHGGNQTSPARRPAWPSMRGDTPRLAPGIGVESGGAARCSLP